MKRSTLANIKLRHAIEDAEVLKIRIEDTEPYVNEQLKGCIKEISKILGDVTEQLQTIQKLNK